jgi:hypothetical protein
MAVTQGDLILKKSATTSDTAAANGGRLSDTSIAASLFPDITSAERQTGKTRFRKVFLKNLAGTGTLPLRYADAATGTLLVAKAFLENNSPAGDYFLMKAGTATDTQSQVVDSGWAGTGYLEADAAADATTLQIRCELNGGTGELFQNGGTVIISEYVNGSGNREFLTLDSPGGVSWGINADANLATLTFTATPLMFSYTRNALPANRTANILTSNTIGLTTDTMTADAHIGRRVRIVSATTGAGQIRRIVDNTATTLTVEYEWNPLPTGTVVYEILKTYGCMCVALGDVVASYANVTPTTTSGTFTATGNLKLFSAGARDDHWTLTFTSATTYTVVGTHYGQIGAAGAYSTGTTARPVNGDSYYFEIPAAAWGGTWAMGEKLEFDTVSSSKSFWIKEVVPATNINPHLSNSIDIGITGDTV